jgi:hypothetical protein
VVTFLSVARYYDVNNDGQCSPVDVLLIINFLNRQGLGEGEPSDAPSYLATPIPWGFTGGDLSALPMPAREFDVRPDLDNLRFRTEQIRTPSDARHRPISAMAPPIASVSRIRRFVDRSDAVVDGLFATDLLWLGARGDSWNGKWGRKVA